MPEFKVSTTLRAGATDATADEVVDRFLRFSRSLRVHGPYRVRHDDGATSTARDRKATAERLGAILPHMEIGQSLRVISANGQRLKAHAVEAALVPVNDVPGTPNVRLWVAYLRAHYPHARLAGTCVAKDDSTAKCNGHNDCAACDHFDTWPHMIASYHDAIARAEDFGVSYTILGAPGAPMQPTIWTFGPPRTFSPRGEHAYTGEPHYHQHVSFDDGICGIAGRPSSEWPR